MGEIKLPGFEYMSQGNSYSGSLREFRYKIFPSGDAKGKEAFTAAHYRDNCYEIEKEAGRVRERSFPFSQDGISEAEAWLLSEKK